MKKGRRSEGGEEGMRGKVPLAPSQSLLAAPLPRLLSLPIVLLPAPRHYHLP